MSFRVGFVGSFGFPENQIIDNYIPSLPKDSIVLVADNEGPARHALKGAEREGFKFELYGGPVEQRYGRLVDGVDWLVACWDGRARDHVTWSIQRCCDKHVPHAIFEWNPETKEVSGYSDVHPGQLGFGAGDDEGN